MNKIHNLKQPRQKLAFSKKTKQWRKDNVDAASKLSLYHSSGVRKDLKNKIVNMNLYNGKVDVRDMAEVLNPNNLDASYIPDNIPHHPILVPKIDLLVGEEANRRFDWKVMVTNSDAISMKEEEKKKFLFENVQRMLQENYQEEELKAKLEKLGDHMKYDWQDLRERLATQILKHYYNEQDFAGKFNDGFKDALMFAEEIYQIDTIYDEPKLTKLNPFKVRTVKSGNSNRIEDASIIVLEDHKSPNQILDEFHEELKDKDVEAIIDYGNYSSKDNYSDDDNNHVLLGDALGEDGEPFMDSLLHMAEINGHTFNSNYTDEEGNIRVLTVYWKSIKRIKKVKYYDEFGETQYKIRSEEYIINKDLGEEETILWVNEMWEGTLIGKDIYIKMKPRDVQYNKIYNPSLCHAGIIGQVYNTNQGKAVSLIDRMKNYQYLYDTMWDRLNKAISTNYGKILELDIAKIPENWEIDKWMHFAVANKIAVVDSFKEGSHGAATGKLAGGMNTIGGRSIDMETGSYIQQHIQLLEFIKFEMGEISGVNQQRQGQVENRETLGGVERAVTQSSHITEWWYTKHEQLKLRVLSAFLETAKVALKGNNKKVQYILDDLSIEMLNMDGDVFSEADYGLVLTSSSKTMELEQMLKQNAQAFMQNGGSMATLMDIYFSDSITTMRKKIEIAEEKMHQRNSEAQKEQNAITKQQEENKMALEQEKLRVEEANNVRDNETKLIIAQSSNVEGTEIDGDDDGIADINENIKLGLDREKVRQDKLLKLKALNDNMTMHKDKMQREDKKIAASKAKASTQKSNG
jgi:hypothetical protein